MTRLAEEARTMGVETLRRVDVRERVREQIQWDGEMLTLGGAQVARREFDEIVVVAVGKAAGAMYGAAREALGGGVDVRGLLVTNEAGASPGPGVRVMGGAHPLPDERSLRAAMEVQSLLAGANGRSVVLFLISGGASAMLEAPLDARIAMDEVGAFHRALIGSGLGIVEMNALRKHFSAVKGGRLAQAAGQARLQCTLLVSDVPEGWPSAIGSGPSLPDETTVEQCRTLLAGLGDSVPDSVTQFFGGAGCVETPKPGEAVFARSTWVVVSSSEQLAEAAEGVARERGFHVAVDNGCDEWEYREAGNYLIGRGLRLAQTQGRVCVVSVGEVRVKLPAETGEGGRNQQFALWCAREFARRGVAGSVLSVGSDGADGNSEAAGAVCDEQTTLQAQALGYDSDEALAHFDCTPLLWAVRATMVTGRTGNNLRDLRLLLFDSSQERIVPARDSASAHDEGTR